MIACRIARRVASMTGRENSRSDAVRALTLATKVFHYQCQSFSSHGDGRRGVVETNGNVRSLTGVWLCIESGGARRVASIAHSSATPLAWAALVTKERNGGVE
jgi:hypothetical protein